jgi:hypothetical protein
MARGPMAGVSGPGKFSKRTDGLSFQSPEYGAGVEQAAIKSGAPLATTPDVRGTTGAQVRQAAAGAPVTPLYAPTERPDEPVTAGVNIGPGAGAEILGVNNVKPEDDTNFRATMMEYLPVLSYISQLPSASPETRRAIRQLRDSL